MRTNERMKSYTYQRTSKLTQLLVGGREIERTDDENTIKSKLTRVLNIAKYQLDHRRKQLIV